MSKTATAAPDEPEPNEGISNLEVIPGEWFEVVRERALKRQEGNSPTLEISNPQAAARILWMLAKGDTLREIARVTGVNRTVIRRLSWRNEDTLETKRKEFSREFALAAEAYKDLLLEKAERLSENPELLDGISPDKLALAMAITTDKSMALAGMAGVIIETRKGASIDDALKAIEESRQRVAKGRVIENEPSE